MKKLFRTGAVRRLRISAVDPVGLGVHPAERILDAPDQPRYVGRDVDGPLNIGLSNGGLVVIQGRSASGKSRSAFEALRRLEGYKWVLVPSDGRSLRSCVEAGLKTAKTVVWLDDLERFLGADGLDAGMLDVLCPAGRTNRLVLATLRSEAKRALEAASDEAAARQGGHGLGRLLRRAHVLNLSRNLGRTERELATLCRDDSRVAAWLDSSGEVGFAEYLAACPEILGWWRSALGDVCGALIAAAIDFRRTGYLAPLPRSWLVEVYPIYLEQHPVHTVSTQEIDMAFAEACQLVRGASSCLTHRADDTFDVFDYLVDHVQGEAPSRPIPVEVWSILLDHVGPRPVFFVGGTAALSAGRVAEAELVLRPLAEAGHIGARCNLGLLLEQQGNEVDAEEWYRRSAQGGEVTAMLNLSILLNECGRVTEAQDWWHHAADGGQGTVRPLGALPTPPNSQPEHATPAELMSSGDDASAQPPEIIPPVAAAGGPIDPYAVPRGVGVTVQEPSIVVRPIMVGLAAESDIVMLWGARWMRVDGVGSGNATAEGPVTIPTISAEASGAAASPSRWRVLLVRTEGNQAVSGGGK